MSNFTTKVKKSSRRSRSKSRRSRSKSRRSRSKSRRSKSSRSKSSRSKSSRSKSSRSKSVDFEHDLMLYTSGYDFKTGGTAKDVLSSYGKKAFPQYPYKITKEMNKERKKNIKLNS